MRADSIVRKYVVRLADNYCWAQDDDERARDDRAVQQFLQEAFRRPVDRIKHYRNYIRLTRGK